MPDTYNIVENSDPRIQDGAQAWRLIRLLANEDSPRSKARAKIRGMIDGNPPYNPTKLRAAGQGQRTNLNFREAEGVITARRSSYYDLIMNADPLVTLLPENIPDSFAGEDSRPASVAAPVTEYADIIAEEFHHLLGTWDEFLFHTMRHQSEMLDYGVGPVLFPDCGDWRFKSVSMGDLLIPADGPANVDEHEIIVFKTTMSVVDLHLLIATPEQTTVSQEMGWNPTLIQKVIQDMYGNKFRNREVTWEGLQHQLKTNSLVESSAGPKPAVVYFLFIREYSGKIGIQVVCSDAQEKQFLYNRTGMYERFSQVVNLFFSEIGDGSYHSVRGMGQKIFPHCEVSNRFLNSMVDGALLASSAVINQRTGAQADGLRAIQFGPLTVLPIGYELADKSFNPNLQGVASVRDVLRDNLNANVGMYRQGGNSGIGAKTAREVNTIVRREAQLETTDISFYYAQWDRLYREMLRRLFDPDDRLFGRAEKDSKQFLKRCEKRGVPAVLLKDGVWRIMATRTAGAGSPALRDLNSQQVLELAPMLDGKGKYEALRNRLTNLVGPSNVMRFVGGIDRREMPVVNSSLARMENGLMALGKPATAGDGEDHLAHLQIHLQGAGDLEQSISGQADWVALAQALELIIRHGYEHLGLMSANPAYQIESAQVKQILGQMEQTLAQWSEVAKRQLQEQEAARAEQEANNTELEKERLRISAELQERLTKEENMSAVRDAKALHQMDLATAKASHQMELDNIKLASKKQ